MTRAELPTDVDVAVIGAGIGGLSAVLALRAAGIDAHAFERAPTLTAVGAAIIVRVQALELLERWTDLAAYRELAVRVDTMEFAGADGTVVHSGPMTGEPGDPDWAHSVHRADLRDALVGGVPAENLHLGRTVVAVADHDGHAEITFADGSVVRARAVVAADGIRSTVRRLLFDRSDPVFSGMVNCRAVVPVAALGELPNDRIRTWFGGTGGLALLPVRGGREAAFDVVLGGTEAGEESWSETVSTAFLLERLGGFPAVVRDIVTAAADGSVIAYYSHDRPPLQRWSNGRITLLGDAAHPMLPTEGQGANQAVQDADVLARELAPVLHADGDVPTALTAYETARKPRTDYFQQKSRFRPVPA